MNIFPRLSFPNISPLTWLLLIYLLVPPSFSRAALIYQPDDPTPLMHGLSMAPGGRSSALAGTGFVLNDQIEALYWNPAGLVGLDGPIMQLSHSFNMPTSQYTWLGYAQPLGRSRFYSGASFAYLSSRQYPLFADSSSTQPIKTDFWTGSYSIALDYSWLLLGTSIKTIFEKLQDNQTLNLGYDFGVIIRPLPEIWSIAATARHLGTHLLYEDLTDTSPVTFQIGIAYHAPDIEDLILTSAIIWNNYSQPNFQAAIEYLIWRHNDFKLKGRTGMRTDRSVPANHWRALTGGLGLSWRTLSCDYTVESLSHFGWSHRLSLTMPFTLFNSKTTQLAYQYHQAKQSYYQQNYFEAEQTFIRLKRRAPWYRQAPLWHNHLDSITNQLARESALYQQAFSHYTNQSFAEANKLLKQILAANPQHRLSLDLKKHIASSVKRKQNLTQELRDDFVTGLKALDQKLFALAIKHFRNNLTDFPDKFQSILRGLSIEDQALLYFRNASFHLKEKGLMSTISAKKSPTIYSRYQAINKQTHMRAEQLYKIGMRAYRRNDTLAAINYWELVINLFPEHIKAKKALTRAKKELSGSSEP